MKRCSKCGETKSVSEFSRDRSRKDGLQCRCKACVSGHNAANREKIAKQQAEYRAANREKVSKQQAKCYAANREERLKQMAEYEASRREERAEYNYKYYVNHRKEKAEYSAKYRATHREEMAEYKRNRRDNDIQYKLECNLRSRLSHAIKNNQKSGSAVRDLGCTIAELKKHLEKQFKPGMNWDNYGEWHIDHIKPLSLFNLEDREQLLAACHYTNLQPLWADDNFSKGAKIL